MNHEENNYNEDTKYTTTQKTIKTSKYSAVELNKWLKATLTDL